VADEIFVSRLDRPDALVVRTGALGHRLLIAPVAETSMTDIEAHRHAYRSPLAAIVGLADAALLQKDLDAGLAKHLRAIRALAQQALEADEAKRSRHRRGATAGFGSDDERV
jgi:hypothetical protein